MINNIMVIMENILGAVGNVPLVKLVNSFDSNQATVYGKLESMNPTGSMKIKSALGMVEAAEERGDLKPGMTIIESTSGNLGYGLAVVGTIKGYEVILVVDPKTDQVKRNILEAYGAKLVSVNEPDSNGAYQPVRMSKVRELVNEIPGSWCPNQYHNKDNMLAHYKTTGPEIFKDLEGKLNVLIGSVGTCGHLVGSSRYLKEMIPSLKVIGVEPIGSAVAGGKYHPYLTQGPGLSFTPSNYDPKIISEIVKVSDEDAFNSARLLARTDGILVGGSGGGVYYIANKLIDTINSNHNVVLIFPDDGFRYSTNFYDNNWMTTHGLKTINLQNIDEVQK